MRSPKFNISVKSTSGWEAAVLVTERYFCGNQKADQLLDALPADFTGGQRATCQSLFLGALRFGHRTEAALKGLVRKKTKSYIRAILLVTGFELLKASPDLHPKIIHHAVERSKARINQFEQGFLNAVLRKLPNKLLKIDAKEDPAAFYSHPGWLVEHWARVFPRNYQALLEWNQKTPTTYLKVYSENEPLPPTIVPTEWAQFHKLGSGASWKDEVRPLLNQGKAYIKDPSTRLAPNLLAAQPGETVLDLCAAPGGKAFDLAHAMQQSGQIVTVDLPGKRIERLRDNLRTLASPSFTYEIVEADLLALSHAALNAKSLPETYEAVMLDAPCSNTGVIQRRTDVKWRLKPTDIQQCAKLQLELLEASAAFVKPGGRLVYSTCSIEAAENQEVVDAFLESEAGHEFSLSKKAISLPWETNHDGAGAFLLTRHPTT
ncbi:MAG: RNA methyltransferase [Verrucomicrobia bacterium]|nr:RNA methyltransferase [Verrucomicrobiota bacterium]